MNLKCCEDFLKGSADRYPDEIIEFIGKCFEVMKGNPYYLFGEGIKTLFIENTRIELEISMIIQAIVFGVNLAYLSDDSEFNRINEKIKQTSRETSQGESQSM